MKRIVTALYVLILVLSSCAREVVEPAQQITGRYALDDGTGLTDQYLEFDKGILYLYKSGIAFPIMENQIWNCKELDYDLYSSEEYSIQEGSLFSDYYSGAIKKEGDIITIGASRYARLDGFREEPYSVITPEKSQYEIPLQEGEHSFPVTIENPIPAGELTASSSDNWITGLTVKEGMVLYHVSATRSSREGRITLKYTHATDAHVVVKQSPSTFIRLEQTFKTISYAAATVEIPYTIENPVEGSELQVSSTSDWCQNIEIQSDRVVIHIPDNNSGSSRRAYLTFSCVGAEYVNFLLTQMYNAVSIVLTPSSAQFDYAGGTGSFIFEVQNPREGASVTAISQANWITDVAINGSAVSYKVAENNSGDSRIGQIKMTYGTSSSTMASTGFIVSSHYSAPVIVITPSSAQFDYVGGTGSFTFEIQNPRKGASVTAISQVDWITDVVITGDKVSYTVAENNSGGSRTGKIKLVYSTSSSAMANTLFTVTQSYVAPSIILTSTSAQFEYTGGTGSFTFEIQNPREGATVTATSQVDWITDVVITGDKVSYKAAENNSGKSRTGKIKLVYGTSSSTMANTLFTVTQSYAAPSIILTSTSAQFEYTSGTGSFSFEIQNPRESISCTATSHVDWITDVLIGGGTVSFKIAENNSWTQRTGNIEIKYGDIASIVFNITQNGNSELIPEGAVDLGLSVCWASCNLGKNGFVSSPTILGAYFAWGESDIKSDYSWPTYKWSTGSSVPKLTKYCPVDKPSYWFGSGDPDGKISLKDFDYIDDAARSILGGNWRIPTSEEIQELINNCDKNRYTRNGVRGVLFESRKDGYKDRSIFIPYTTGFMQDNTIVGEEKYGYYWSSSIYKSNPFAAYILDISSGHTISLNTDFFRYGGILIRPVTD